MVLKYVHNKYHGTIAVNSLSPSNSDDLLQRPLVSVRVGRLQIWIFNANANVKDKADPTKITNTQRIDGALPTIKKVGI